MRHEILRTKNRQHTNDMIHRFRYSFFRSSTVEETNKVVQQKHPTKCRIMSPKWSHVVSTAIHPIDQKCLDHALVIRWGSIYMINMCLYMQPIYTVIYPLTFYEQYHSIIHLEGSVMLNYSPLSKPYKTRIPLSILTSTSKGVC